MGLENRICIVVLQRQGLSQAIGCAVLVWFAVLVAEVVWSERLSRFTTCKRQAGGDRRLVLAGRRTLSKRRNMDMKKIRLWKRDYDIIENIKDGFFTTRQLAKLYFSSQKKAAERLKSFLKAGLADRFQAPLDEAKGKPEYVYCKKGGKIPKNYSHVKHSLAITDFYVWLIEKIKQHQDVIAKFYYGTTLEDNGLHGGLLLPDAFFILEKADKKLLYFVEIDLGTETLRSGSNYSFEGKLDLYSDIFDSEEYNKILNHKFIGFRLLCVFTSHKRMQNFLVIAKEKNSDFVLCSTFDLLKNSDFLEKIWADISGKKVGLSGK